MTPRKDIYGKKKEFIINHFDDIMTMRKRMSARKVSAIYAGIITQVDIYNMEKILKGA